MGPERSVSHWSKAVRPPISGGTCRKDGPVDGPFQVDPVDPTGQLESAAGNITTLARSTSNLLAQVPARHLASRIGSDIWQYDAILAC